MIATANSTAAGTAADGVHASTAVAVACASLAFVVLLMCALDVPYFFRSLFSYVAGTWFKRPIRVTDTAAYSSACLTSDLDVYLSHMNNARYLREVDLARIEFLLRTGVWRELRRRGGLMFTIANSVRYRKFVRTFQRYEIRTRLVYWDDVSVFFEHRFVSKADQFVRAIMHNRQRVVGCGADELLRAVFAAGGGGGGGGADGRRRRRGDGTGTGGGAVREPSEGAWTGGGTNRNTPRARVRDRLVLVRRRTSDFSALRRRPLRAPLTPRGRDASAAGRECPVRIRETLTRVAFFKKAFRFEDTPYIYIFLNFKSDFRSAAPDVSSSSRSSACYLYAVVPVQIGVTKLFDISARTVPVRRVFPHGRQAVCRTYEGRRIIRPVAGHTT